MISNEKKEGWYYLAVKKTSRTVYITKTSWRFLNLIKKYVKIKILVEL